MTEIELRIAYLDWIQSYCNNKFDINILPGGVQLALNQLTQTDPLQFNIVSERLSDMSITYSNDGNIPKIIYNYLRPYKRIKII